MSNLLVPDTEELIRAKIKVFKQAGLSTEKEEAELASIVKLRTIIKDSINPALEALTGASGIDKNQAKTVLYYAIATHLLPDKLSIMPVLAIIGPPGTGKTSLMKQLERMVNCPKWLNPKSSPSLRDSLDGTITALIEEADKVDEDLIGNRYSRETSKVTYKIGAETGWITKIADIFGATILHRRLPFKDPAVKSRSIIIPTKYNPGNYKITDIEREEIMEIAKKVTQTFKTSDRVRDSWKPLQIVAMSVNDNDWLGYSESQIQGDIQSLLASQNYEPEQAVMIAIREAMVTKTGIEMDVLISDLKYDLKHQFDLPLKSIQIQQICQNLGFKVTTTGNYPRVKANKELLDKILSEYELKNKLY